MSTPEYYKYDDGETHFECFDISRYYSGDWAQVIQYVFRWQKKGGVEDLEKALKCANDAYFNSIDCKPIVEDSRTRDAIIRKLSKLKNADHASASKIWRRIESAEYSGNIVEEIKEMIEDVK